MSYRLKSILAASLLPLAACTPPPGVSSTIVFQPLQASQRPRQRL